MKRRGIRYVIPIIFIAVLVGAMVTYVLLHKNTEAEKGLDYASLIGVTGDSDFQNYWDTDGRYDLGRKCIRQRKQFFCAASNEEGI